MRGWIRVCSNLITRQKSSSPEPVENKTVPLLFSLAFSLSLSLVFASSFTHHGCFRFNCYCLWFVVCSDRQPLLRCPFVLVEVLLLTACVTALPSFPPFPFCSLFPSRSPIQILEYGMREWLAIKIESGRPYPRMANSIFFPQSFAGQRSILWLVLVVVVEILSHRWTDGKAIRTTHH